MTNIWHDGTGVPSNSLGNDNDYYLRIDKGDVYKKEARIWMRIGNIRGDKGVPGEPGINGKPGRDGVPGDDGRDGKNGSSWIDGVGVPQESIGEINDYYLDISTADIYKKVTSGNWDRIGNISAPEETKRRIQRALEAEIEELKFLIEALRNENQKIAKEFSELKDRVGKHLH